MEDLIIMGMNYDQWMNVFAGAGILLLFGAYYLETRGRMAMSFATKSSKFVGFGLICVPLFSRWFLSESVLLFTSIVMIIVCLPSLCRGRIW